MNLKKLFLGIVISIYINAVFTQTAADEDAAEVDYYVRILANDAMSQVNFLLCFVESTNFSTFIDKGVYKALLMKQM